MASFIAALLNVIYTLLVTISLALMTGFILYHSLFLIPVIISFQIVATIAIYKFKVLIMQVKQDTICLNYQLRPSLAHIYRAKLRYTPIHLLEEDLKWNTFDIYENGRASRVGKDKNDLIQECISLKEVAYDANKDAISDIFEVVYRNENKRIDSAKVLVKATYKASLNIIKISIQQNTFEMLQTDNYRTFVALSDNNIVQKIINKHVLLRDILWHLVEINHL